MQLLKLPTLNKYCIALASSLVLRNALSMPSRSFRQHVHYCKLLFLHFMLNPVPSVLNNTENSHHTDFNIKVYGAFPRSLKALQRSEKCDRRFFSSEVNTPTSAGLELMLCAVWCGKFPCFVFYHLKYNHHSNSSFKAQTNQ